jgi:hypothetical protein
VILRTDSNIPELLNQSGVSLPTFFGVVSHIPDNPNLHANASHPETPFSGSSGQQSSSLF